MCRRKSRRPKAKESEPGLSFQKGFRGTRRDLKIISTFCYLKPYEGAEIIISTGVPDPLEGMHRVYRALKRVSRDFSRACEWGSSEGWVLGGSGC